MKEIYYVRHGQSETNLRGVFAGGQDDTPLTKLGREQARQAGRELKGSGIERIICSPLSRAYDSAKIIAGEIGFSIENIEINENFREYDIGSGNGLPVAGMTAAKMVSLPGAEDPEAFADRVRNGLLAVANNDKTTLIVGHGAVGRMIETLRTNSKPADFFNLPGYPNAHPVELNLDWLGEPV